MGQGCAPDRRSTSVLATDIATDGDARIALMELPDVLRQAGITRREAEVLEALGARLTNAEIADRLFISVRTVESHVSALLGKLQASDRLALARISRDVQREAPTRPPLPGALAEAVEGGPFVGRAGELERLLVAFDVVATSRRRRLVVISGEAGIGKTRVAAEAAARMHARGALVLYGRGDEDAFIPFQAFAEAVRPLVTGSTDPMAVLPGAASGDPRVDRYALFERFDRTLSSRSQPTVLVLDDVQGADPSGLQLLRHLLRATGRSPLLVIATTRPDGLDPRHPLATAIGVTEPLAPIDIVVLGGLSLPDVAAIADGLAPMPADRVRDVWERTGGNPFLVSVLLGETPAESSLTAGARDRIVRRIAGLGPAVVEALTGAAVAGDPFRRAVLAVALGGDPEARAAAFERAVGAGFIVEAADGAGDDRFAHSIVRDALIAVTPPTRRADLHLRIAGALEAIGAAAALPEIARHRHAALPAGDPGLARRAALAAAAHAMERLAYEVADACAGLALDALDIGGGDDADRARALITRGHARHKAGSIDLAIADFRSALDVARRAGDDRLRAQAVLAWCSASPTWERDEERLGSLEEALGAGLDALALRAELQARLAQALYYEDTEDRRRQLARTAVHDARTTGRPDIVASVLAATHAALWGPEDLEARTVIAAETVAVARSAGHFDLEAGGLGWLLADRLEAGDLRGADAALERHAVLGDRTGQRLLRRDTELWRAMRAILDGRFDDAAAAIERAREEGEAAGDPSSDVVYWVQRYWLGCERGDPREMDELVEPCERFVRTFDHVPAWRAALALLHARRGDHVAAREPFKILAAHDFASIPRDFVWLNAMTYLAETCAFLEDRSRASVLLRILAPFATRNALIDRGLACKGSVARFVGLLAATNLKFNAAERHLRHALERHEAMGARPLVERTYADLTSVRDRSPTGR